MENLSSIFGKGAWGVLKEMHLDIVRANVDSMTCDLVLSGTEYRVARINCRMWRVQTSGYWRTFGSQWELLDWLKDLV